MQGLCVTGGGAGHQALQPFAHQPLVCLGSHFTGHVLLGPFVHPGLESLVQPLAHSLVGLEKEGEVLEKGGFGLRAATKVIYSQKELITWTLAPSKAPWAATSVTEGLRCVL